jgi:hypothetical protein
MMAMKNRETILAVGLGGAMVLAVSGVFVATHYQALLHPGAVQQTAAAAANPGGLNIPTIDEMCKAVGATSANMAACQNDENAAAEFVVAWMGLNGFIVNGSIDVSAIEFAAELGPDASSALISPDPSLLDPSLDPSLDPTGGDPTADLGIDPQTGLPLDQTFETPAQIAQFCLGTSMDWLQMHDCISKYDPSTQYNPAN